MRRSQPRSLHYDEGYHRVRRSQVWTRRLIRANVVVSLLGLIIVFAVIVAKLI